MPHEHLILWLRATICSGSDVKPGTCPMIGDNPVADAKAARSPGSPRRKTWGTCAIVMFKSYPLPGYGINCRGRRSFVSIAPQVVWPQTVNIKIDDSHILSPRDVVGTVRSLSVVKKRKICETSIGYIHNILWYTSTFNRVISYHPLITYSIPHTRHKTQDQAINFSSIG